MKESTTVHTVGGITVSQNYQEPYQLISDELGLLNLKLLREFRLRRNEEPALNDDVKGFFIPAEDIENILTALLGTPRYIPEDSKLELASLDLRIKDAEEGIQQKFSATEVQRIPFPLLNLQEIFQLSKHETDVLLIALAPELDKTFETVYAYFNDDLSRKSPTVDLALKLIHRDKHLRHKGWGLFAAESPLIRHKLIHLSGAHQSEGLLNCHFRLDERIKHYLLGNAAIDSALTGIIQFHHPGKGISLTGSREKAKNEIRRVLSTGPVTENQRAVFWLYGKSESDKRELLRALSDELGFPLLLIDLEDLQSQEDSRGTFQTLLRESFLRSALIYFSNGDLLQSMEPGGNAFSRDFFHAIKNTGVAFIGADSLWVPEKLLENTSWFPVECKQAEFAERKEAWKQELGDESLSETHIEALAARYNFGTSIVRQTVEHARQTSGDEGISFDLLCRSANLLSSKSLNQFARRIQPHFSWDDIVLPEEKLKHLKEITSYVKNKHHVFHAWGFIDKLANGRGVNILFSGASGTGKTMAADVMAAELKLELYKIDLSSMVSKYIGETEKNLNRLFNEMSSGNTILFFDEADAIFGKRSEVKDAHDRYANIEVNYLLQKIEEHDGVVILATNLKKNIDDAFSRRMNFSVEFPFPEKPEREHIWRKAFPRQAPLDKKIDFDFLAEKLKFSGGNIKNIALTSAFYAIENGGKITMGHIINAAKREYQKVGKSFVASDFDKPQT